MRADEEATLKSLGEYRDVIDGLIARHEGRVFSTGSDSVLAEFGSTVEAVAGHPRARSSMSGLSRSC